MSTAAVALPGSQAFACACAADPQAFRCVDFLAQRLPAGDLRGGPCPPTQKPFVIVDDALDGFLESLAVPALLWGKTGKFRLQVG